MELRMHWLPLIIALYMCGYFSVFARPVRDPGLWNLQSVDGYLSNQAASHSTTTTEAPRVLCPYCVRYILASQMQQHLRLRHTCFWCVHQTDVELLRGFPVCAACDRSRMFYIDNAAHTHPHADVNNNMVIENLNPFVGHLHPGNHTHPQ